MSLASPRARPRAKPDAPRISHPSRPRERSSGAGGRDRSADFTDANGCDPTGSGGPGDGGGGAAAGGLHILVNSGSYPGGSPGAIGPIETLVDDELLSDFDVKYVGALRCSRASIPFLKEQGWGRIINISGGNARNAGNLSGGARNVSMVHMTKTLSNHLGCFGITANCLHPGVTRTERTPGLLEARAAQLGISPEEVEQRDFAPDSTRGNAICRMVDASEIGYLTAYLCSDKAWAVTGEVIAAGGGTGTAVYY